MKTLIKSNIDTLSAKKSGHYTKITVTSLGLIYGDDYREAISSQILTTVDEKILIVENTIDTLRTFVTDTNSQTVTLLEQEMTDLEGDILSSVESTAVTAVDTFFALSTLKTNIESQFGSNAANINTEMSTYATNNDVGAIAQVALDVDGRITGWTAVDSSSGGSAFKINADTFALADSSNEVIPFSIDAPTGDITFNGNVTVNGLPSVVNKDWGSYASDPSGGNYTAGDTYYNTVAQVTMYYTGTAWTSTQGIQGEPGIDGIDGTDGIDGYTPVKGIDYFDGVAGTDGSDGDSAYQLWIAAGNTGSTTDFLNSLIGADGADGSDGIQGPPGEDGITTYTWVKYADSGDGTVGFSNAPIGKPYIGFAFNKTTATESSNPSDYTWSLIKGETGAAGEDGDRGSAIYATSVNLGATAPTSVSSSSLMTYWDATSGSLPEVAGDQLILTNSSTSYGWTHIYSFNGTAWVSTTALTINGDMVVDGTISGDKIVANSISADRLLSSNGVSTVWSGGGLVSSNFNGNVNGNIGSPTKGFRLSSSAAGTSDDPNIYGAYIKGSTFEAIDVSFGEIHVKSSTMPLTNSGAISYTMNSGYLCGSSYSTGYLINRVCGSTSQILIRGFMDWSCNNAPSYDFRASLQYSIDNGPWVTLDSGREYFKNYVSYVISTGKMNLYGLLSGSAVPSTSTISFRMLETLSTGGSTSNLGYTVTLTNS